MSRPYVYGSGVDQHVAGERLVVANRAFTERYDRAIRLREHLWIATVCYYITPPITEETHLDAENIAMSPGVGCYICEALYEPRNDHRRCPGEPTP